MAALTWKDTWGTIDWANAKESDIEGIITKLPPTPQNKDIWDLLEMTNGTDNPLILATRAKNTEAVKKLLSYDAKTENSSGPSALAIVALNGDIETAALLIQAGADVNIAPQPYWTDTQKATFKETLRNVWSKVDVNAKTSTQSALQKALDRGDEATARILIRRGADVNCQNVVQHPNATKTDAFWNATTPLVSADLKMMRFMFEYGDCESGINKEITCSPPDNSYYPLQKFTSKQGFDADKALFLIEKGADVNVPLSGSHKSLFGSLMEQMENATDENRKADLKKVAKEMINHGAKDDNGDLIQDALTKCLDSKDYKKITLMLGLGANPNVAQTNDPKESLLIASLNAKQWDIAKLAVDNGAGINDHSTFKLVHTALENEADPDEQKKILELQKSLLAKNAPIEEKDGKQLNAFEALCSAIKEKDNDKAKKIIDLGIDLNAQNDAGLSLLAVAAKEGNLEIAKALMDKGVKVDEPRDKKGRTPLMYAVDYGREDVVDEFIKRGADVNAQDNGKWSPMMYAAYHDNDKIANKLYLAGSYLDTQNKSKKSALHVAAEHNSLKMAKFLVERGASSAILDSNGATPITIARDKKENEFIETIHTTEKRRVHDTAERRIDMKTQKIIDIARQIAHKFHLKIRGAKPVIECGAKAYGGTLKFINNRMHPVDNSRI